MKPPPAAPASGRKRRYANEEAETNNSSESQQSQIYRDKRNSATNLCIDERLGDVATVYMAYFLERNLYHSDKKSGFVQAQYDPNRAKNYPFYKGKFM